MDFDRKAVDSDSVGASRCAIRERVLRDILQRRYKALPLELCAAARLDWTEQVLVLYGSMAQVPWRAEEPGAPAEQLPSARCAVVSAVRRLHGLPAILPMDPGLYAVWSHRAGGPLTLLRLALEEARLLGRETQQSHALDEIQNHLDDDRLELDLDLDPQALAALRVRAELYVGLHRMERTADSAEGIEVLKRLSARPMPRDALTLAALAELKARTCADHPEASKLIEPLILAAAVLHDEPRYLPRLAELGALRHRLHLDRKEVHMAERTLRWLTAMIDAVDWSSMPEMANWHAMFTARLAGSQGLKSNSKISWAPLGETHPILE